jgi:hypothetical protein
MHWLAVFVGICVQCMLTELMYLRVLELQAFLVEMVGNFEFTHVHDPSRFRRELSGGVTTPVVEGQYEKGCQLPLRITPVSRNQ